MAMPWRSSVVVHCRGDGHAPPDLSPSDEPDNEEDTNNDPLTKGTTRTFLRERR